MAEYYDPATYPKEWNYLQPGTIIDQYVIERELAHGGFSSVYLARQREDQVQVAIKEYLPRKLAHRTWNNKVVANDEESLRLFRCGRNLFLDEAKVLANLKHPNIVEVVSFFSANSTVYIVMTYDYGIGLDKMIKQKKMKVTLAFLLTVFNALLDGVEKIHQHNFVHLDIKPANILIRPGYNPLLLDFGAVQDFPEVTKRQRSKVVSKGFSPVEQCHGQTQLIGPWTDLYAVGASIRSCMEAKAPVSSVERLKKDTLTPAVKAFKRRFPETFLKAIDWAMTIEPEKRPQSVQEFRQAFQLLTEA
jgi:serine/threonine protein kinase